MGSGKEMSLGERMKTYENVGDYLTPRMPKIIRIDGKAFHTYTKGMVKPFDEVITHVWIETAKFLCKQIMGAKLAYFQSDELSILYTDYDQRKSEGWFDNRRSKIESVSASMATAIWNRIMASYYPDKIAFFDARVSVYPKEEVANYFLWREQDSIKNSISAVAQANFPHKRLQGLNGERMKQILLNEKGIDWNLLPGWQRNGVCVTNTQKPITTVNGTALRSVWEPDMDIPIFSQDKYYIERYLDIPYDKVRRNVS